MRFIIRIYIVAKCLPGRVKNDGDVISVTIVDEFHQHLRKAVDCVNRRAIGPG